MLEEVNKFTQKNNKYRPYNWSLTQKWHQADYTTVSNDIPTELLDWCQTTCRGRFSYTRNYSAFGVMYKFTFYFRDVSDKIQFVLAWQ